MSRIKISSSESEASVVNDMIARLKKRASADAVNGLMKRDTHAKMYGLVKAEFHVKPQLPPKLAVGLFKKEASFQAWVRFSNQDTRDKPDASGDIRGMAIKLMNVAGKKFIEDKQGICPTHDFLLISSPMFIAKDPKEFDGMLRAIMGNLLQKICFFTYHWRLSWNLFRSLIKIANPLHIAYYSATPYRFGDHIVKYAVIPQVLDPEAIPDNPPHDFLRQAMQQQLHYEAVYFDFCVQFQTTETSMPVEDPRIIWSEKASPFHKVATIKIMQQDFDNAAQDALGENLSFNPWRALPEHQPLGAINHSRLAIYLAMAEFRHSNNQAAQHEPEDWEISQKS
jgi:catalase